MESSQHLLANDLISATNTCKYNARSIDSGPMEFVSPVVEPNHPISTQRLRYPQKDS